MPQPNPPTEHALSTLPTQQTEPISLDPLPPDPISDDPTSPSPPIDGGPLAWRLLLAAFIFEALLWGFPLSFGVFQAHYTRLPAFASNPYLPLIGTSASGISYLGAPLATPLIRRYSAYRTHMILVGWPLCIAGLVAGSFADRLGTLVLTQGVMYGVGFVVFYYPILSMVDEFWVQRRGMAYGVLCGASGVSGAVTPFVLQVLLGRFGYKGTLRGVAGALVVLTGPLIPLLRGRKGHIEQSQGTDWAFLSSRLFWTYSVSNVLMGIGFFFPSLYLPSYAAALGLSGTKGALLLALMSVAQVAGQFTFGYLSDGTRVSLNALIAVSLVVAGTATLSTWGLAQSLAPLVFFVLLYGFFGAGYTAMWARMVSAVSGEAAAAQAMFGLFCFGKGVGNVLAGPIGAGLLARSGGAGAGGGEYGHGMYMPVVVFTGVCLLASAGSLGTVYLRPKS